jgi:leucyl-tRNA---protein transferase
MSDLSRHFHEFQLTTPRACPYLPGRLERKIFTRLNPGKPHFLVDKLLKSGFHRSQNIAYMPHCEGCRACVSVRIPVDEFKLGRSMRRIARRNGDLQSRRTGALATFAQYGLFRDYVATRHRDSAMTDMSARDYSMMVEDSAVDTFVGEYHRSTPADTPSGAESAAPLVGVALCDRLSDGVSLIYSFYAPELRSRSLGTYIILDHIAYARSLRLPYVYLGFWIHASRKMAYKARFMPQERLTHHGWMRIEESKSPLG